MEVKGETYSVRQVAGNPESCRRIKAYKQYSRADLAWHQEREAEVSRLCNLVRDFRVG
jgi:hypothetical protein